MNDLWFKRKKYGWGWTPANAKGWIAVLIYGVLALSITPLASISPMSFIVSISILTAVLIWICYKKGEKPKWSWGSDKDT